MSLYIANTIQDAALASLKSLNKNDVVEVRALQRPPPGVRMVIEAVSIMKEVKPKKVAGEKIGTKVDDYWEPGKAQLQDPTKFLESLFKYDKVNLLLCMYIRICMCTLNLLKCTHMCVRTHMHTYVCMCILFILIG